MAGKKKTEPKAARGGIDFDAAADQLQAELDKVAGKGTRGAAGGIVAHVQEVIAALRAGDVTAIVRAVRDCLNDLLGEESSPLLAKSRGLGLGGFDWKAVLKILLPLILQIISAA